MRAGIALGSNLGERRELLRAARDKIRHVQKVSPPFLCSSLYETAPVGCEAGAQKFLNAVMEVEFDGAALALLAALRDIEVSLGRKRDHARNRSRTLDLDLLYLGDCALDLPELKLPHPRLHTRRFVLAPLAEIRPDLILPAQTEPVRTLLERLQDDSAVVCVSHEW